jgi:hypothetical protein
MKEKRSYDKGFTLESLRSILNIGDRVPIALTEGFRQANKNYSDKFLFLFYVKKLREMKGEI